MKRFAIGFLGGVLVCGLALGFMWLIVLYAQFLKGTFGHWSDAILTVSIFGFAGGGISLIAGTRGAE